MLGYALSLVQAYSMSSQGHSFSYFVGGFTVLSTKALSTLLTMEWIKIFTEWITYPVIAVSCLHHPAHFASCEHRQFQILLGTGIGQIRYLNRALMRFDSKVNRLWRGLPHPLITR